jgi:fibronectin-binding autotransporter adhesin
MKKLFIICLISIIAIVNGLAQTVTTTVAVVNGTAGQVATVPVTVSGIDENNGGTPIIGFQASVTYQTSIASYLECVNLNSTLSAGGTWIVSTINNGTVAINWLANDLQTPVSVVDGETLYEIHYNGNNAGTSPLTLINVEFYDVNNNVLNNSLNNGSITFGSPAATTTWNGTASWYTAGNWSNGIPGAATHAVIASGVATIDAATAYTRNLTINPGAGITLNSGKALSVNGNFVLESDATSTATGSFLNNGTLTVTGTVTVKRYLTGGTQHFVSVPTTSATIANLIVPSNPGYLFNFVEASSTWNNPWAGTYQLQLATGYSVNYTNAQTISLTIPLNNDSQYAPTITKNGDGWNLVGNPYACPLDWTNASGWTKTNLDNATYIWNNNAYAAFVNGVGTNGGTKYIPEFQGFFVKANAAAPAIAIKKAARTQAGNSTPYLKDELADVFKMSISNGTLGDQMAVYMFDGATTDFDGEYDAYKLFGFNEDAPHIYTVANDVDYAINAQPVSESISLPVTVKTSASGQFTFTSEGFASFDPYTFFILEDQENGTMYDLQKNPSLSLNLNQGETSGRFILKIFKSSMGIGDQAINSIRIYAENKKVYIENCPKSEVRVYNLAGEILMSQKFSESVLNSMEVNVPTGIYVVKVIGQDGMVSSKVFIK